VANLVKNCNCGTLLLLDRSYFCKCSIVTKKQSGRCCCCEDKASY